MNRKQRMEMNNYKRRNVKSKQNQQIATSFTSPVCAQGQHTAYDLQVQSPPTSIRSANIARATLVGQDHGNVW